MSAKAELDEAYADDHPYMDLFGSPGRTKILAAFVGERTRDVTISYVAQLAGVERSTVYDHLDDLLELGVIEKTREMGGSNYYSLSDDSELANELYRLEGIALANKLDHEM